MLTFVYITLISTTTPKTINSYEEVFHDGRPHARVTWKNVNTQVQTATLQNDICVTYIVKDTYASTKLADEAWKEVQKDKDYAQYVTRDGKTITQDLTEEFKGLPKEVLRGVMQNMAQEMERGITK